MAKQKKDDFIVLSPLEEDILTALSGRELYGLQIIKKIAEASNERRKIGFGSLYPTLHKLDKKGFVKPRWGDELEETGGARRKYYKITVLGSEVLTDTQKFRSRLAGSKLALVRVTVQKYLHVSAA